MSLVRNKHIRVTFTCKLKPDHTRFGLLLGANSKSTIEHKQRIRLFF
jgi:hypothetical protein